MQYTFKTLMPLNEIRNPNETYRRGGYSRAPTWVEILHIKIF